MKVPLNPPQKWGFQAKKVPLKQSFRTHWAPGMSPITKSRRRICPTGPIEPSKLFQPEITATLVTLKAKNVPLNPPQKCLRHVDFLAGNVSRHFPTCLQKSYVSSIFDATPLFARHSVSMSCRAKSFCYVGHIPPPRSLFYPSTCVRARSLPISVGSTCGMHFCVGSA